MGLENPKVAQTFIDLSVARCNEKWTDIPELTKRYKKFHPYESVLEFTSRMEAEFILQIRQIRSEKVEQHFNKSAQYTIINGVKYYSEESDIYYQLDDPNNVSLPPRIEPTSVQLILARLSDVIQRQIKTGELETPDDWQAQFSKIILSRIYFETGRYEKALEWLQNLALRLEDVEIGYGLVLLVQARVIKAICFEMQEKYTEALESYFSALRVVDQHPEEQNRALSSWIEDCLYRAILLHLRRKGPVKQTLKLMRSYLNYSVNQWASDWRIHKRWIIFRHYIRYLTRAYQKGLYVPASPDDEYTTPLSPTIGPARSVFSDAVETTLFERSAAALDETIQLMNPFRSLLALFAQQLYDRDQIDLHHRTLEYTNLLFSAHETVGWGDQDYIIRISKYLHRSRKLTFNSLAITRCLFHTLVRHRDLVEARLTLRQYLELVGIPHLHDLDENVLEDIAERIQNKLDSIVHASQTSATQHIKKIGGLIDEFFGREEDAKRKPATGATENDMEFDVVKLILTAVHELYSKDGYLASTLSELAVAILEESEHLKKKKGSLWKSLMVQSRRSKGSSYGLYAEQCKDPEKRFELMNESLTSYKRATELDPRAWQTYYELGLQQAIMGDMVSAATSVKRSVRLRSDFIPSWHLLSLIQSSRQFHALPKSLQVIQAGLVYHVNMLENIDNETPQDQFFMSLDTEEGQEFFERAIAYINLRLSQMFMLEQLEGSESVVKAYPDLFDMYAKLSKRMGLVVEFVQRKSSMGGSSSTNIIRPETNNSTKSTRSRGRSSLFEENGESGDYDAQNSSFFFQSSMDNASTITDVTSDSNRDRNLDDLEEEVVVKKEKKQRRSINISNLDDPLLSIPSQMRKSKEKKSKDSERKELRSKKSNFLSIKKSSSPFSSSPDTGRPDSTHMMEQSTFSQEELTTSSFKLSESTIQIHNQKSQLYNSFQYSSSGLIPPSSPTTPEPTRRSSSVSLSEMTTTFYSVRDTTKNNGKQKAKIEKELEQRWQNVLVQIWIKVSASYRQIQKFEDAWKSIMEADQLTQGQNADVWHQIGLLQPSRCLDAFKRALTIDPTHVQTHISLAMFYLESEQVELAEQLLERVTKEGGWNQPEAWYLLGKVYKLQNNIQDAKNSLVYALRLSDTNPIQPLDEFPRFV